MFFTGKMEHACKPEEKEGAQKQADNLSFTQSMLIAMNYAIENIGDICDWQGYYRPEIGKALLHAYDVLKPYGWTFANDDDKQLLDGTHGLYVKKEEETHES